MRLIAFVFACAAFAAPALADDVIVIRDDWGGGSGPYMYLVDEAERTKTPVRFEGPCKSACTYYTFLPSAQLCATEGASFHFHAPISLVGGPDPEAKEWLMKSYPVWVRRWIENRGGLTSDWLVMPASYIRMHLKECE